MLRSFGHFPHRTKPGRHQASDRRKRATAPSQATPELLEARTLLSTVIVTSSADSGPGSLRAAIASAASGDTITFADSLMNQTITLSSELAIPGTLDIQGPGAADLTISGGGATRIFSVGTSGDVTISGLSLTDGMATNGGAILENTTGSLTVNDCVLANNQAVDDSSLNYGLGGAIEDSLGALNVSRCAFNDNHGDNFSGGAIDLGFANAAPAAISQSTFTGNLVASPGNAFGGAIGESSPQTMRSVLTVDGCTFTNNVATTTGALDQNSFVSGGAIGVFNTATIINSTFTGNMASGGSAGGFSAGGGAISAMDLSNSAGAAPAFTLTVTGSTITGNSAVGAPGADGVNRFGDAIGGGLLDNGGPVGHSIGLVVRDSTITGNDATGGALDLSANPPQNASTASQLASYGGGIASFGPLSVTDSTISGNQVAGGAGSSSYPGAIGVGGGIALGYLGGTPVTGTVTGSTIANNTALGGAGQTGMAGGAGAGGGIDLAAVNSSPSLTVINTTIYHNQALGGAGGTGAAAGAGLGGGIDVGTGAIFGATDSSTLTLTNSTISGNLVSFTSGAKGGGAIHVSSGTASLFNTIAADNRDLSPALLSPDDISGTVNAVSANNLIGLGGSGGLMNGVNGNLVGVSNPGLGQLANNGGPTQTLALLPGSPAIDAGSNALAVDASGMPLATDQRGLPRISNGTVDIGAFELQPTLQLVGTTVGDGTAQRSEVRSLTFKFNQPVTLSSDAVTLALLNTGGSGTNNGAPPTDVSAALATPSTSDGGITWVFTFLASDASTVDRTGSLRDGIYTATLHAAGVSGSNGPLTGGDQTVSFHRLFGDINGDGTVNNADYFKFNKAFNSKMGDAAYNAAFDFNGDGVINNTDYFQFNKNFGKKFSV